MQRWVAVVLVAATFGCGDSGGASPDAGLPPGVNVPPDGALYRLEIELVSGDGCPAFVAWPGSLTDSVATSERCTVSDATRTGDSVSASVDCPGPYDLNRAWAHLSITAAWSSGEAVGSASVTLADDFGTVCTGVYDVQLVPADPGDTPGQVEWRWN